ncbi:MAG: FkbM family methyltransferase [Anaerolineales bacterium]|nr:FkbM family methyltransferase [Anaerolineales bacterium]
MNRTLVRKQAIVLGHVMFLDDQDSMGLSTNGIYEPFETALIQNYVKPGQTVLDIGANIGYYTLLFAKRVGGSGVVHAFEPESNAFKLLEKNLELNGYQNVVLHPLAVSNKDGETYLARDPFSNLDHRIKSGSEHQEASIKIRTAKIDSLIGSSELTVDVVKLDIQGAEYSAVQGMQATLSKSPTVLLLSEFWPEAIQDLGADPRGYYDLLLEHGFKLNEIDERGKTLTPINSYNELQAACERKLTKQTNLLCTKGRVSL